MSDIPLISIIIPCYNVEPYLERCVDSIINQSYINIEVILVDDGSTDGTPMMCDKYQRKDDRIIVIHQSNQGLSEARNSGMKYAHGLYWTFVDSDDFVRGDYIEHLYKLIKGSEADIAVSSYAFFSDTNVVKVSEPQPFKTWVYSPYKAVEKMFYQELFDTTAWGKLYKASFFCDIKYPKNLLFEDLPTTYKLLLKANKIAVSTYPSYYYYLRDNSIEGSAYNKRKYDSLMTIVNLLETDQALMPVKKALNCRVFSFVFRIYLSVPPQNEEKKVLWEKLKSLRWGIVINFKSRRKAKIAAILSYFGQGIVAKVYKAIKTR